MTDELKLLERIRPEYAVRDTPPPLDWGELEAPSAGETHRVYSAVSRRRRALLSAAAALIVVIGAVQLFRHDDRSTQLTPAPSTATTSTSSGPNSPARTPRLAELADIASAHPVAGTGDVHYVKFSKSNGQSHQVSERSEYWIAPDLSGSVKHEIAPSTGPSDGPFPAGSGITVHPWCWLGDSASVLADAGTTPEASYGANGMMWLIQYCALSGPPSPSAQAALLGALSNLKGVIPLGETTDPLGRSGEGFMALVAVPEMKAFDQSTIIIDPASGQLLALIRAQVNSIEDTTIPADTNNVVFEDTAMVTEVGQRPA